MTYHHNNPYLEELNYQKAQQARYERGVRITGDTNPTYAHELHDTITALEAKAEYWEYENVLSDNNLRALLLPAHVTDTIVPHMEDISEYEGLTAKLTVTYDPATSEIHCGIFSFLDGEELSEATYDFNITNGQGKEYKPFISPCEFTYQLEPETDNLAAYTTVFLPELSYNEDNRKITLRPHGLYLLAAKP